MDGWCEEVRTVSEGVTEIDKVGGNEGLHGESNFPDLLDCS